MWRAAPYDHPIKFHGLQFLGFLADAFWETHVFEVFGSAKMQADGTSPELKHVLMDLVVGAFPAFSGSFWQVCFGTQVVEVFRSANLKRMVHRQA